MGGQPEHSHLVTPRELRELTHAAGFEVTVWNDLTQPSAEAMRAFLAAPPSTLGLHVFVPGFRAKAENLAANLEQNRARLIQAVLVAG